MYPPSYTDKHAPTDPDEFSIEGEPAVLASVLRIDFVKDTFDRRIGTPMDPPAPVLTRLSTHSPSVCATSRAPRNSKSPR
jgi:hypothetical protein